MPTKLLNSRTSFLLIVFFISIGSLQSVGTAKAMRDEGIPAEASLDTYSGSEVCAPCHQKTYDNWKTKPKASFVNYRQNLKESLPVDWKNSPIKEKDVLLIVGKRKKLAFVDRDWHVLPYEFKFKNMGWKKRKKWAKNQYDYRIRCAPCHTVALELDSLNFIELNIGCESCHGPGKNHSENPAAEIAVPGKNSNILYTCQRCHNSRKNHARELDSFNGSFHNQ